MSLMVNGLIGFISLLSDYAIPRMLLALLIELSMLLYCRKLVLMPNFSVKVSQLEKSPLSFKRSLTIVIPLSK